MNKWELLVVLVFPLVATVIFMIPGLRPKASRSVSRSFKHTGRKAPERKCFSLWPEAWLVVKSRNLHAVETALGLHNARPCSWLEGFTDADQLFVAPPVKGWILVIGRGLPNPGTDIDACFRFILELSRRLGPVQFFSGNQLSFHHAWVKADSGRIIRAYAWAGSTLWQQGRPTVEEIQLDLQCFNYLENPAADSSFAESNVRKLRLLAQRWGLDPARIPEHFLLEEHGLSGKPAHRLC